MPEKEIIVIDSQRLSTVQGCGYKYDLTFNRDLIPIDKQEALEKGDLMHKMLQVYYSMHKYRDRWPSDFTRVNVRRVAERAGTWFAKKMSLSMGDVDENFRVFWEYLNYYWGERFRTLAVEQVGSKILYEDENLIILYETKIDWIIEMPNAPVVPVDHKTYSRKTPPNELSNQFMGYCWMLGVSNIIINRVGFQTTLKPHEKFVRPTLSYPRPVIDEWVNNSVYWIKQLRKYREENYFPRNYTNCDKYNRLCIFRPVCTSPEETRLFTVESLFDQGDKWDVGSQL